MRKSYEESHSSVDKSEFTELIEKLSKELKEASLQIDARILPSKEGTAISIEKQLTNNLVKNGMEEDTRKLLVNLNESLKGSAVMVGMLKRLYGHDMRSRFEDSEVAEILMEYSRRQKEEIRKLKDVRFEF